MAAGVRCQVYRSRAGCLLACLCAVGTAASPRQEQLSRRHGCIQKYCTPHSAELEDMQWTHNTLCCLVAYTAHTHLQRCHKLSQLSQMQTSAPTTTSLARCVLSCFRSNCVLLCTVLLTLHEFTVCFPQTRNRALRPSTHGAITSKSSVQRTCLT